MLEGEFKPLAASTLNAFSKIAATARARSRRGRKPAHADAIANLNQLGDPAAIANLNRIRHEVDSSHALLAKEPAVARVVAKDHDGNLALFYICRTLPISIGDADFKLVSYRAPVGRMASLPVGAEYEFTVEGNEYSYQVLETVELHPALTDEAWDSLNSVISSENRQPLTVASLHALLESAEEPALDENRLEQLLQEEAQPENILEGIRRDVLTNMDLRDQPILDQFQDEIFRLPLSTQIFLLGAPGTGKTSTLIRRLGQKLDLEALDEGERRLLDNIHDSDHSRSWILFTPTELLKQYTKEAFSREGIAASDDHITTWDEYRWDLARNVFRILRAPSRLGGYILEDTSRTFEILADDALVRPSDWFYDFYRSQAELFWADIRAAAEALATRSADAAEQDAQALVSLGQRVQEMAGDDETLPTRDVLPALSGLLEEADQKIGRLRDSADRQLADALNRQVNLDRAFLDAMAAEVASISRGPTAASRDQTRGPLPTPTRAKARDAYYKALSDDARAAVQDRRLRSASASGKLLMWLGERRLTGDQRIELGGKILLIDAARRLRSVAAAYVDGIPERYRRYRTARQLKAQWYRAGDIDSTKLHPLEVDLLLCAMLFAAAAVEKLPSDSAEKFLSTSWLTRYRRLFHNQILVDEATDFSPLQLRCMSALANPVTRSFFACGDFNQRITDWGTRSPEQVTWAVRGIQMKTVSLSYRQSAALHSFVDALVATAEDGSRPGSELTGKASIPEGTGHQGVPIALAEGLADTNAMSTWISGRILEIETSLHLLPTIAILVNAEDHVEPVAAALARDLADHNIRVAACSNGRVRGSENEVRVFDVKHIKGLEFEAVFFLGVDRLAADRPDLFDKCLYVGATRAATYLGLTCEVELPARLRKLPIAFEKHW